MAESQDDIRELLRRVRAGSEDAARELVSRYGNAIRRAIRRRLDQRLRPKFDSLDFVQAVWQSFFRTGADLEHVTTAQQLLNYLLAIAQHRLSDETRRRLVLGRHNVKREQSLEGLKEEDLQQIPDHEPDPVDVAIAHERRDRLLENLSPKWRQIVQLKIDGHSCRSIADQLGISDRTVRRVLGELLQTAPIEWS